MEYMYWISDYWHEKNPWSNHKMAPRFGFEGQWVKDWDMLISPKQQKIINIKINDVEIKSTPQINVLGVIFDNKLQWTEQVLKTIKKSNKNLNAIRMIAKFFKTDALKILITSNFYSALYYNSEIWHLPDLAPYLKSLLLSASAKALKLCTPLCSQLSSYQNLHEKTKQRPQNNFAFTNTP